MTTEQLQSEGEVRQVSLPAEARARSTLAHVDYEDCFLMDVPNAQDRTAEEWARAVLEGAPTAVRTSLRSGWRSLGMRVGPEGEDGFVLGWEVRRSDPDAVLLGATSRLGMQGELLLERHDNTLLFATLVQFDNRAMRGLWASAIERPHVRVVRYVLEQARGRWG